MSVIERYGHDYARCGPDDGERRAGSNDLFRDGDIGGQHAHGRDGDLEFGEWCGIDHNAWKPDIGINRAGSRSKCIPMDDYERLLPILI